MTTTVVSMVCDDTYEPGFLVTVGTLLAHNPWFDHEIRVVTVPGTVLSPATRRRMVERYPNTTFHEVDAAAYQPILRRNGARPRLLPAFAKLEAFNFTDADRVVGLDSDLLVIGDLSELFACSDAFNAVEAWRPNRGPLGFANTGVFIVNGPSLTGECYRGLLDTTVRPDSPTPDTADQAALHERFGDDPATRSLPLKFNLLQVAHPDSLGSLDARLAEIDGRILHFSGKKPWFAGASGGPFRQAELRWRRAYLDLASNADIARMLETRRGRDGHGLPLT